MFNKILIANRGEIAVRIIRACHELGVESVSIYSQADRTSPHVLMADEAYLIGPPPSNESYLRIDKILNIAKEAKVDAIHPGYGFLSENPDFAKRILEAGFSWIGPSPEAMKKVGNKVEARKIAKSVGVPIIPGSVDAVNTKKAIEIANQLGYPILLKAVGGGGGKGMRIVHHQEELHSSIERAKSEAEASFSDNRVYIEKFLPQPRHIEIQVAVDNFGHIITMTERECSIQRRYQKLIEESPSPFITRTMWKNMAKCAEKIIRESHYNGVGTVEFLVNGKKKFYFLEINARLQVEHPVTEMILGTDLVCEQIRLSAGEKLSLKKLNPKGYAIECRIYAEDGFHNFMPSTGIIHDLRIPGGNGIRFDHALYPNHEITPYYDPLLGKLIAWGNSRVKALKRMEQALTECMIIGVNTTIPFCKTVITHPRFIAGDYTTHFIDKELKKFETHKEKNITLEKSSAVAIAALHSMLKKTKPNVVAHNKSTSIWKQAGRKDGMR